MQRPCSVTGSAGAASAAGVVSPKKRRVHWKDAAIAPESVPLPPPGPQRYACWEDVGKLATDTRAGMETVGRVWQAFISSKPSGPDIRFALDAIGAENPEMATAILHDALEAKDLQEWRDGSFGLHFQGRAWILSIPRGLVLRGGLFLSGNDRITGIPEGVSVSVLNMTECHSLKDMPTRLSARDTLVLANCRAINRLPDGMRVAGLVDLSGCSGLTRLPERFQVDGWLDLRGTGITALPPSLLVKGVILSDAAPEGLKLAEYRRNPAILASR